MPQAIFFETQFLLSEDLPPINPLIAKVIEQEKALKDFLGNQSSKKQFWINSSTDSIDQIAFFENNTAYKFLLVDSIKISFHDVAKTSVLFEITFLPGQASPQITIYREEDDQLKMMNISLMELTEKSEKTFTFNSLVGSTVELTLKIHLIQNQKIYQIINHFRKTVISINSLELIENPTLRFRAYLDFFINNDSKTPTYELIQKQALILLDKFIQSEELQKNTLQFLSSDPSAFVPIYLYKNKIPFEVQYLPHHIFLEETLLKKFFRKTLRI